MEPRGGKRVFGGSLRPQKNGRRKEGKGLSGYGHRNVPQRANSEAEEAQTNQLGYIAEVREARLGGCRKKGE